MVLVAQLLLALVHYLFFHLEHVLSLLGQSIQACIIMN